MSKPIIKTQVRFPEPVHEKVTAYADKHQCSMNEAILRLVSDGALDDSISDHSNKNLYIDLINKNIKNLSAENVREVCKLVVFLNSI